MIILGDIGNTETKICLVNNNKIIKKFFIPSKGKKKNILNKHFKKFNFSKLKKYYFLVLFLLLLRKLQDILRKKQRLNVLN